MSSVNRIHFGFSDWTIGVPKLLFSHFFFGQLVLSIYCSFFSHGVSGQRIFRPTSPSSSIRSVPSTPPPSSSSPFSQTKCPYTSEDILSVIVTSVIVTIIVIGLTLLLFWFLWRKKLITFPGGTHSIRDVDLSDKTIQVEVARHHHQQQHQQCKQQKHQNGNLLNDEDKKYKRLIKSLPPLTSVFNHISNQSKGPIKSVDDTFIMTKPEQVRVQMTGHDFTGLGFNICGNMRDGIYIKDVLTRGPAHESGLIKAGDRIISITVSFEKMVYEDALTILSYASPYDVTLQVEKTSKSKLTTSNNLINNGHIYMPRRYANGNDSSDQSSDRILHPVFRSHSVGELTIRLNDSEDKPSALPEKSFGSIKSINSLLRKIKTSLYRSTASIKSDQTDKGKATSDYCSANGFNEISGGYHHSCYSLDASGLVNGQISTSSSYILPSSTSILNHGKATFHEVALNMSPEEPVLTRVKPLSSSSPEDVINNLPKEMTNESNIVKQGIDESIILPLSPSTDSTAQAKKLNQGKRKAPAPPSPSSSTYSIEMKPASNNDKTDTIDGVLTVKDGKHDQRSSSPGGSQVEIHAVIHQEQGSSEDVALFQDQSLTDISDMNASTTDASASLVMGSLSSEDPKTEPHEGDLRKEMNNDRPGRACSPTTGKSKSCSLSDLTLVKNKKPSSSIILERAVSLDLKEQLGPEENNIQHQGVILEDNQGLLRWNDPKPIVCGPDSLSTTHSSEMLESSNKTNDFTDDSLIITVDEGPSDKPAPKPAERPSLKRNSLSDSESKSRSSNKFETIDLVLSEEETIVAPPDGFGSDANQSETANSSRPLIDDVKMKPATDSQVKDDESYSAMPDVIKLLNKTIGKSKEKFGIIKSYDETLPDKTGLQSGLIKPSTPEKILSLISKFEGKSVSQERLDSTLFDVTKESKLPIKSMDIKEGEKERNVDKCTSNNNKYGFIDREVSETNTSGLSHEDFLAHRNKVLHGKFSKNTGNLFIKSCMKTSPGHTVTKPPPATIIQVGESGDNDFESWSYLSDIESNPSSLTNEMRYMTTCDMGQLNEPSTEPSPLESKTLNQ